MLQVVKDGGQDKTKSHHVQQQQGSTSLIKGLSLPFPCVGWQTVKTAHHGVMFGHLWKTNQLIDFKAKGDHQII